MDGAIFQFNADSYELEEVQSYLRSTCERLTNIDEVNVTKFDLGSSCHNKTIETLLNDDALDTTNCYYRVFIG